MRWNVGLRGGLGRGGTDASEGSLRQAPPPGSCMRRVLGLVSRESIAGSQVMQVELRLVKVVREFRHALWRQTFSFYCGFLRDSRRSVWTIIGLLLQINDSGTKSDTRVSDAFEYLQ